MVRLAITVAIVVLVATYVAKLANALPAPKPSTPEV
jgi:hypothetical protein